VPIYEYQCSQCGEIFEVFQKINDEPVATCRFCTGTVERLISHTSFQLKGAGWYLTDYARKSAPSSDKDSGKEKSTTSEKPKDSVSKTPTKSGDTSS
jgi:putative FmdB family regulatory protein